MKPLTHIFQETVDLSATPLCRVLGKTRKPQFVAARHRFWASAVDQGYRPVNLAQRFRVNHTTVGQAILKQKNGIGYLSKLLRNFGLSNPKTSQKKHLVRKLKTHYENNHPSREYQFRIPQPSAQKTNPNAFLPEGHNQYTL
jgi:hypothetical protein